MSTNGGFPLGVGIDVQSDAEVGPLDVLAGLSFSIRNMADELKRENERRDRMADCIPGDPTWSGSGKSASSGSLTFDLCGGIAPSPGHVWQVRRIVVGGAHVTDAVAGTVYVFRQPFSPDVGTLANWIDSATLPMPQPAFYGTHQFIVRPGDHLWALVTSPTASTQYTAAVQVEDWREDVFFSSYSE